MKCARLRSVDRDGFTGLYYKRWIFGGGHCADYVWILVALPLVVPHDVIYLCTGAKRVKRAMCIVFTKLVF